MTPLEAIAEALKEHVFENDEDFERWCKRFARSLKASGYELTPCERDEERLARLNSTVETRPMEFIDPMRYLKAKAKEMREEKL